MLMNRRLQKSFAILLVMVTAWLYTAPLAHAEGLGVLRDSEIEEEIRFLATPIWQAAGLDPKAITIILAE